jgi:hypothetical protein
MEWSNDLSYGYFERLLDAARASFSVKPVSCAPSALCGAAPTILLRHDVDLDLAAAVRMGDIESRRGIASTYMVMTTSPFYRLEASGSIARLKELEAMGHEIALHFDFADGTMRSTPPAIEAVAPLVDAAARRVEDAVGSPVRSVSFHRPLPGFLHGPLYLTGRVSAYARELMRWYLSDSAGRWREGEPLPMLERPKGALLQLLIHPIWWGERHRTAPERLQDFYDRATPELSAEDATRFSSDLADHIRRVRRSGATA